MAWVARADGWPGQCRRRVRARAEIYQVVGVVVGGSDLEFKV